MTSIQATSIQATSIQAAGASGAASATSSATDGPFGTVGVSQQATGSSGPTASTLGSLDQDVFLKLLVAQMKYQDPTNPTDSTEMLAQTAQYTVVEKLEALSDLNQKVLDASTAQSAAAMLGRTVTWKDLSGVTRTGVVTATTFGSRTPTLTVGGASVSIDDVTSVATT